jgi:hypothetical protein
MAVPGLKNKTLKWKSKITLSISSEKKKKKEGVSKIDNYKNLIIKHSEDLLVYQTMLMKIKLPPIIKMVFFMAIDKEGTAKNS